MDRWLHINPRTTTAEEFPYTESREAQIAFLLTFAVRAPSTHNTQPWKYAITDSTLLVYPDQAKELTYGDPHNHYLYISIGAFVENFAIAAEYFGLTVSVQPSAEALVSIEVTGKPSHPQDTPSLFSALSIRKNPRGVFSSKAIPPEVLRRACKEAHCLSNEVLCTVITEKSSIAHIAKETGAGVAKAHANPKFRREMSRWMKNSLFPGNEGIPGYTLGMPFFLSFIVPTLIQFVNMGKILAQKSADAVRTAPAVFLFGTRTPAPTQLLELGRAIERVMLYLQKEGYATSIFVGSLEGGRLSIPKSVHDGPIQFIFVAGTLEHPSPQWKYSPRHPVGKKML